MINIEPRVEELLQKSAYQAVKIRVEPLKGKPFNVTSLDIEEGSFSIQYDSISRDTLEIGNMTAAELKMTLLNPYDAYGFGKYDTVFFAGAKLTVMLMIFDDTVNQYIEMPFGVFTIDQQPRMLEKIEIAALDNMIRLDIPFSTSGLPSVTFIRDLVEMGLEKAGLYCADTSMFGNSATTGLIESAKIKSESPITWRQVLMWCCECAGVNGIADENGHIKFGFYKKYTPDMLQTENADDLEAEDGELLLIDGAENDDFPLTPSIRFADNSEVDESDIIVTGFQFKDGDKLYPEDAVMDYGLQSEGNLIFSAANERAKRNIAKTVNAALAGFTYRPYSCKIISFPHLQTLDSVNYSKDGKHHHSIITNLTFKLNGEMSISAKAKSAVQKGWASFGALTPGQRVIIDSISQRVDTTRSQLSSYENALLLFNEKMLTSMGLYKTTENDPNGGLIVYFHNKETLEDSDTIYMFGAEGFAWTTNGWNDGSPVWHYGFTSTGDAIFEKVYAYKISAEMIQTGTLQSENGASWISLRDGTFCFGSESGTALKLETDKTLSVYGQLRNLKYSNYSVSVGPSEVGSSGALTVTDSREGYGDLFQVYGVVRGESEKGTVWTAPFLTNTEKTNRKGISVLPNTISVFNDATGSILRLSVNDAYLTNGTSYLNLGANNVALNNGTSTLCLQKDNSGFDDTYLTSGSAYIGVYRDTIRISNKDYNYVWFNYYEPYYKYVNTYHFGSGYNHGYADIHCARIECGAVTSSGEVKCTSVNSSGYGTFKSFVTVDGEVWASAYNTTSDINRKENIVERTVTVLKKLSDMKFYSYDIKGSSAHVEFGTMANEAPKEIQTADGKGIELYSYIGLTAKGVQELNAKFETQEKKIKALEERIEKLEKLLENLMQ